MSELSFLQDLNSEIVIVTTFSDGGHFEIELIDSNKFHVPTFIHLHAVGNV